MTFFYDLNTRLAQLAAKQDAKQIAEEAKATAPKSQLAEAVDVAEAGYSAKSAAAGKDLGKPGKNFAKIAKSAGERYGSKAAGERVAGAVLNKLRHAKEGVEESARQQDWQKKYDAMMKTPHGRKAIAAAEQDRDPHSINKAVEKHYARVKEAAAPMTPKQKSFAKLAPPADKITFADKIAGAKQEVDEMLGDVAAEAMKSAVKRIADEGNAFTGKLKATPKGGKFKLGNKEFKDTSSIEEQEMDEGYAEMDAWLKSREKEKGTGKFDSRKTSTGTVYTRKPETFDEPEGDEEVATGPKKKGRPAGTRRAIGAKGPGVKSKLLQKGSIAEGDDECCPHCGHSLVDEVAPPGAKAERMVKHIKKSLSKDGKLSDKDKAIAYATTWKAKKAGKVEEESTDKEDTRAEKAGKRVAKDIEHDEGHKGKDDNRAEKAGKKVTKDIEYDDKKDRKEKKADKEEKVDETSAAPKSSKGMQFGKGVYESLNAKLENMISEGMNVTVNMNSDAEGDAQKSITVTATGAEADKLAELLKMAGLESQQETCPTCGEADCGCDAEMVDENSPDWPTNTDTLASEPNLRTYSGGLNGPKSTGQTTIPVIASQLRRQTSMEENVDLERTLFKTWKNYKG